MHGTIARSIERTQGRILLASGSEALSLTVSSSSIAGELNQVCSRFVDYSAEVERVWMHGSPPALARLVSRAPS